MILLEADENKRADLWLSEKTSHSRTYLQKLIEEGNLRVNGVVQNKKNFRLEIGDQIELLIPQAISLETPVHSLDFDILYQDEDVCVLNKPAGILTHPLHEGQGGTLVSGLLHKIQNLSGINGVLRPGIVHRLDRDTSGVMVVAKNDLAHQSLMEQFSNRQTKKVYYALVCAKEIPKQMRIERPLGRDPRRRNLRRVDPQGKPAVTLFELVGSWSFFHLLKVRILTGRTHQIRVHLASEGFPIVGDKDYFGRLFPWVKRVMLHSFSLEFLHPFSKQTKRFSCPLAEDMKEVILKIKKEM